ncbi:unnamed protein product, partial [Candidula unifasciata]
MQTAQTIQTKHFVGVLNALLGDLNALQVDCPDSSDEKNCYNLSCSKDQWQCADKDRCIANSNVCDGFHDCFDHSDEIACSCADSQFHCTNGLCIPSFYTCDGDNDCGDKSDELNYEAFCGSFACPAGRFKCATSNECIQSFFVCDGLEDCKDKSDENNCYNTTCLISGHWNCADKSKCILGSYVCDGFIDCADGSDEMPCSCLSSQFKCTNGLCIPTNYQCDEDDDCGDTSDELNCPALPSNVCRDVLTYNDCFHMNETTHPICLVYSDGDKFCRKFCGFCIVLLFSSNHQERLAMFRDLFITAFLALAILVATTDCEEKSKLKRKRDKSNCHSLTCSSGQWQCADQDRCVPNSFVCDGYSDCSDHSDERVCSCSGTQFKCTDGLCIPRGYACDGDNDCGDKSDELN